MKWKEEVKINRLRNNNDEKKDWEQSYFIKLIIAGFSFLTTVINFLVAVFNLIKGQSDVAVMFIIGTVVCGLILVVSFALVKVQRNSGIKTKRDYDNFKNRISQRNHELLHKLRDAICHMDDTITKSPSKESFEETVTQDSLQFVDLLSKELTEITGYKIRVCIKSINYLDCASQNGEIKILTFARSGKANIVETIQEHKKSINVSENTDFSEIVENGGNKRQRQFFYEKNLAEYDDKLRREGKQYRNSNISWKNDYITTIVCPIRSRRRTHTAQGDSIEYDLRGFLCVDSLDENAFQNEYSDFCFDLLEGLADILYVYLNKFISYYNDIA